jgi:hypothetical protein
MRATLYPAKVTLVVEHEGQPPAERIYQVMAKSRANAIEQAYKQLPRREHDISHVQGVLEYVQV